MKLQMIRLNPLPVERRRYTFLLDGRGGVGEGRNTSVSSRI
jgi:hypothetical protein